MLHLLWADTLVDGWSNRSSEVVCCLFDYCIGIEKILLVGRRVCRFLVRLRERRSLVSRCQELSWLSLASLDNSHTVSRACERALVVGMLVEGEGEPPARILAVVEEVAHRDLQQ